MDTNINNPEHKIKVRNLVRVRAKKQKQNPHFRTTNSWRYKRVDERWRRPRGIDNKMGESRKGWPRVVMVGYRTPRKLRGLRVDSKFNIKEEYLVRNMSDLELVLPFKHVARIAHTVGKRKKEEILENCQAWGIQVINLPAVSEEISSIETEEDLSLDRDLSDLDLDLEDLEETKETPETGEAEEALEASEELEIDVKESIEDHDEGEDLLADEFKAEDTKSNKKQKK